jgi:two-component system, chemotaxis family, protein-glutamate methylesterase/glutaminase
MRWLLCAIDAMLNLGERYFVDVHRSISSSDKIDCSWAESRRRRSMPGHDIIVIGASAGGVEALPKLVRGLPPDLPAALLVVLHLPPSAQSFLPEILQRSGQLPAFHPKDRTPIEHGLIYVAPPDHHLLVEDGKVRVVHGPRENRHRPAIDPLFRTAAQWHGARVVGIILTGYLGDGTGGLETIKIHGGVTVVQDPAEALAPSMPKNALRSVQIDHCLPVAKISDLILKLAHQPVRSFRVSPEAKRSELAYDDMTMNPEALNGKYGPPTGFICPECNGPLWEGQTKKVLHYQCLVGHRYSPESLLTDEAEALERGLWAAVKTLEERSALLRRLATRSVSLDQKAITGSFESKAQDCIRDALLIRKIIQGAALKHDDASLPKTGAEGRRLKKKRPTTRSAKRR